MFNILSVPKNNSFTLLLILLGAGDRGWAETVKVTPGNEGGWGRGRNESAGHCTLTLQVWSEAFLTYINLSRGRTKKFHY